MKKAILFLSMGVLANGFALAQRISLAPEIGVNFNTLKTDWGAYDVDNEMKAGIRAGGVVDIGITRRISFQPGLFYSQKGSKNEYTRLVTGGGGIYEENIERNIRINYVEIPLNVQVTLGHMHGTSFFVGAGPYIAFATGGEIKYERTMRLEGGNGGITSRDRDSYDLEIGNDADEDDVKKSDAGLNLNLGFMGRRGFYLRGNMGIGLSNIIPEGNDDYSAKNFGLGLSLGYMLGR